MVRVWERMLVPESVNQSQCKSFVCSMSCEGHCDPCFSESTSEHRGLGASAPGQLREGDDEFDAYRKRMMFAYRFRPNPLVSRFNFEYD